MKITMLIKLKATITRRNILLVIVLMCFVTGAPSTSNAAQGNEARRIGASMDLFPSFLAADKNIKNKKSADGTILIYFLYTSNYRQAEQLASRLSRIGQIKGIKVTAKAILDTNLFNIKTKPAAIFISEPDSDYIPAIVKYGKTNRILTFSPFEGDVDQGITGGIIVTARIMPLVNETTLTASSLKLKPFFLRISTLTH